MRCFDCNEVDDKNPILFDETVELELAEYDIQESQIPKSDKTEIDYSLPLAMQWKEDDFIPETIVTIGKIGEKSVRSNFNCLMDSGGSTNLIALSKVPLGSTMIQTDLINVTTAAGMAKSCCKIKLSNVHFPEFSKARVFTEIPAYVYDDSKSNLRYDLILGRPFQRTAGFNVMLGQDIIEWNGLSIAFHPKGWWRNRNNVADLLENSSSRVKELEADLFRDPTNIMDNESFISEIKHAKYEPQDVDSVVSKQDHLSDLQRQKLKQLFQRISGPIQR
ncbi:MAG: retropepsin-like aspartic protease, partial [Gloeomargaritales cyanobacterium]